MTWKKGKIKHHSTFSVGNKASPSWTNCSLLQWQELVCPRCFPSLFPLGVLAFPVCPEGWDAAEQGGYTVLSTSIPISVHPCIAISSVSKGSFGVTAYGWPLPVKENLSGALTQLCAQHYFWSMLCSSGRGLRCISFPVHPDRQPTCNPSLFPPRITNQLHNLAM